MSSTEAWYNWSFVNHTLRSPICQVGWSCCPTSWTMASNSWISRLLILKRMDCAFNARRIPITLEKKIMCKLLSLWTDLSDKSLKIIDFFDCRTVKQYGTITPLACTAHQTVAFLLRNYCCWHFLAIFVPQKRVIWVFANPEAWITHVHEKDRCNVRKRNRTTCFPHTFENRKLVEHICVAVVDVLVLSPTETYESAFSGCSVCYSEKF